MLSRHDMSKSTSDPGASSMRPVGGGWRILFNTLATSAVGPQAMNRHLIVFGNQGAPALGSDAIGGSCCQAGMRQSLG